jgi:hypothetical protein
MMTQGMVKQEAAFERTDSIYCRVSEHLWRCARLWFHQNKAGSGLWVLARAAAAYLDGGDGGGASHGPNRRKTWTTFFRSGSGHHRIRLDGAFFRFCVGLVFL